MNTKESVCQQMSGPLAPLEAAFRVELARTGYTASSTRGAVAAMARLSRWLKERALLPSGLTPYVVADLRIPQLGPVLRFLRKLGEVPAAESATYAPPV